MNKKVFSIVTLFIATLVMGFWAMAGDNIATLRGSAPLNEQGKPPTIPRVENKDIKRKRNYPMQPPTIPHKIDNYQVDLRTNKCMTCHSRKRTEESQAPMISVTHYMDRDGNFFSRCFSSSLFLSTMPCSPTRNQAVGGKRVHRYRRPLETKKIQQIKGASSERED